jgi:molecular chaperone DnaK
LGIEALSSHSFPPQTYFCPIIHRNSPLPATYEETFYTITPEQQQAEVHVYQGESRELKHNRSIGRFMLVGLNESEDSDGEILVRFDLTLDGTLEVTAVERRTGLSKSLRIDNALSRMEALGGDAPRARLEAMFHASEEIEVGFVDAGEAVEGRIFGQMSDSPFPSAGTESEPHSKLDHLLQKARSLKEGFSDEDRADIERLLQQIEKAQAGQDLELLAGLETELDDLLFYLVG